MPVILPHELDPDHTAPHILAHSGWQHCLGWQARPARKGGATYILARRTRLDDIKILERYPLTEDGWAQAWQALISLDAASAEQVLEMLEDRCAAQRAHIVARELAANSLAYLPDVIFMGGYAPSAEFTVGSPYGLRFVQDRLVVLPGRRAGAPILDVLAEVLYSDIEAIDVGGPGLVKKLSPGQQAGLAAAFGVLGGLVAYGATKIKTVVQIQAAGCELFFLHQWTEPDALRIELSRGLGAIRQAQADRAQLAERRDAQRLPSLVDELGKLASMLDNGLLTRQEFDHLKAKLIADS